LLRSRASIGGFRTDAIGRATHSSDKQPNIFTSPDQPHYDAMRETVLEAVFGDGKRPAALDPIRALVKDGRIIDAVAMLRRRDGLDLTTASARIDELRKRTDA
jgi:hypothetical protein